MGRWYRMMHNAIQSTTYEAGMLATMILLLAGFITYRCLVVDNQAAFQVYLTVHLYCLWSAMLAWIYNVAPRHWNASIERHRRPNGDVTCDLTLWLILMLSAIGLFGIPALKFRNRQQNCDNTNSCIIFMLTGPVCTTASLPILSLALDDSKDAGYVVYLVVYVLIYIYLLVNCILNQLNLHFILRYYNPLTYIFMFLAAPVFRIIQTYMKDPDSDLKPKDDGISSENTSDEDMETDLEGYGWEYISPGKNWLEINQEANQSNMYGETRHSVSSFKSSEVPSEQSEHTSQLESAPDYFSKEEGSGTVVDLCPMCNEVTKESQHIVKSGCGHQFHFNCFMTTMKETRKCQECDEKLKIS